MEKIFIIAEAGVNHNGNIITAKKLVDMASDAGADAVKFQTFKAEALVSKHAPKAEYQKKLTDKSESQFDMIKKLELDAESHKQLMERCRKKKIMFLSTPFDIISIDLLVNLGIKIFKIPSGEITNLPYLRRIGQAGEKAILSTGMSNFQEVKRAIKVLMQAGMRKSDITVLHCNSAYPTPYQDVNLKAMVRMKSLLHLNVGYSDHTIGTEVAIAAAALGATIIEKHFTLDRNMKGPDHSASIEPHELKFMVKSIRNVEAALGSSKKIVSASESVNIKAARKSIVALNNIFAGEYFTERNITVKRPDGGLSPFKWDYVIGKKAKKYFSKDELIVL